MQISGSGTIDLNQPLTTEAVKLVKSVGEKEYLSWTKDVSEGDWEINLDDINAKCFDGEFLSIVEVLAPLGYILNGCVEYWGDYDGKYYITDNKIENIDIAQTGLYEATDEELIEILTERGYTVTKEVA